MGLQRAGFSDEDISQLKRAYRLLYRSGLKLKQALDRILTECGSVACPASRRLRSRK